MMAAKTIDVLCLGGVCDGKVLSVSADRFSFQMGRSVGWRGIEYSSYTIRKFRVYDKAFFVGLLDNTEINPGIVIEKIRESGHAPAEIATHEGAKS